MSESDDLHDWNPFDVVEEDREKLEQIADARRAAEDKSFPAHLLTSDPDWVRGVIQRSRAERLKDAERDYVVPAPEIPARLATGDEWPRAAKMLLKKLDGWSADGWFMRGPVISGRRILGIKSAFVLRADHESGGRKIRVIFHLKEADDVEGEEPAKAKWDRKNDWMLVPTANVPWQIAPSVKALEAYVVPPVEDDVVHPEPIPLEG